MHWYIVTPCFNALRWLPGCLRSVLDQAGQGVEVHHHVQDGASTDGSAELLAAWAAEHADCPNYRFTYASEKDSGLYQALNRAWNKLPPEADFTAHLNTDEQYLPHALRDIATAFAERPQADIITTTYCAHDREWRYHCHRRPVMPHAFTSRLTCELMTCVTFWRVAAFRRLRGQGLRFDESYRSLADLPFYAAVVASGVRIAVLPRLISSSFAITGANVAWSPVTDAERARYRAGQPLLARLLEPWTRRWSNFQRRLTDRHLPPPTELRLYHADSPERQAEPIPCPTCLWKQRSNNFE